MVSINSHSAESWASSALVATSPELDNACATFSSSTRQLQRPSAWPQAGSLTALERPLGPPPG